MDCIISVQPIDTSTSGYFSQEVARRGKAVISQAPKLFKYINKIAPSVNTAGCTICCGTKRVKVTSRDHAGLGGKLPNYMHF